MYDLGLLSWTYALNLLCHHMGSTQSVGGHLIQIGHVPFAQLPDYAMLVLCPQLALPAQTDWNIVYQWSWCKYSFYCCSKPACGIIRCSSYDS